MNIEESYYNYLSSLDQLTLYKAFHKNLRNNDCVLGEELLPTYLQPYFMDREKRSYLANVTEKLTSALEKICVHRFESLQLNELLPMSPGFEELCRIDPHYTGHQMVIRLDAFYDPRTEALKVIEFNCGDPSGMGFQAGVVKAIEKINKSYKYFNSLNFQFDNFIEPLKSILLKKYREFCINRSKVYKESPSLALMCKAGSLIEGDFRKIVNDLTKLGSKVRLVDPFDFTYRKGRLYVGDEEIDIVYRDIIDDFWMEKREHNPKDLLEAYKNGDICLLNPISSAAGDFKNINYIMKCGEFDFLFTSEEHEVIEKHIPETFPLTKNTQSQVLKNKDKFILKPNVGFGGYGVVIGHQLSEDDWTENVDKFIQGDCTVQEYVEIPKYNFSNISEDLILNRNEKYVNINLWAHGGKFTGAFVRASEDKIINVCQGGGLVPVCWYSEV